jgi:hypothetical protein
VQNNVIPDLKLTTPLDCLVQRGLFYITAKTHFTPILATIKFNKKNEHNLIYRKIICKKYYNLSPLIFFVHLLIIDKSEILNQVL